jgi:hypothetical protein
MMRNDVLTWILTATTIVASIFWVMRSDRHRIAGFELDCTVPPATPDAVRASVGPEGVTFRWQLDRQVQIATSYLVEAGSAPGAKDVVVVPVPRGVETVTLPLPQGTSFARVLARNYCGTSLPSGDMRIAVP